MIMHGSSNFDRLRDYIIEHSESTTWDEARQEWDLNGVEVLGSADASCPCGYFPIRELCWLRNRINQGEVYVGNVCVNRFMPQLELEPIRQGLKRIRVDTEKAPNAALLKWAHDKGVITDWEYEFGMHTRLKRDLSARQRAKRREVNRRIQARLCRRPAPVTTDAFLKRWHARGVRV
jgi:hypothetical protein